MKIFLLLFFTIILFNGCTSKNYDEVKSYHKNYTSQKTNIGIIIGLNKIKLKDDGEKFYIKRNINDISYKSDYLFERFGEISNKFKIGQEITIKFRNERIIKTIVLGDNLSIYDYVKVLIRDKRVIDVSKIN